MSVSVSKTLYHGEDIHILKVEGNIDSETSPKIEHEIDKIVSEGNYNLIIDLGKVEYISSSGWGIFINHIKEIRENGGDLKLVSMKYENYDIYVRLEFYHILKAYRTVKQAIIDFPF